MWIENRHITVRRSGDALLLDEERNAPSLTAREREILHWVARGSTNSQISEALWIAPTTVRKHLENIYAKLGVHGRAAAVSRFFGVAEDEGKYQSASA
jgi:DNA-binding CsgD family transcriptional regulator